MTLGRGRRRARTRAGLGLLLDRRLANRRNVSAACQHPERGSISQDDLDGLTVPRDPRLGVGVYRAVTRAAVCGIRGSLVRSNALRQRDLNRDVPDIADRSWRCTAVTVHERVWGDTLVKRNLDGSRKSPRVVLDLVGPVLSGLCCLLTVAGILNGRNAILQPVLVCRGRRADLPRGTRG